MQVDSPRHTLYFLFRLNIYMRRFERSSQLYRSIQMSSRGQNIAVSWQLPCQAKITGIGLNVVVEWAEHLTRSREPHVQMSATRRLSRLRGFPPPLQTNSGKIPQIRPRPISSTSFPVPYSFLVVSFDAM